MFLIIKPVQQCLTALISKMIVHDPVSFFSNQSINPDECVTDIEITESIIIDSIIEFFSTSAARNHGVPSSLLLKCAAELASTLTLMIQAAVESSMTRKIIHCR